MRTEIDYIIQVSNDNKNWGTAHWAPAGYTEEQCHARIEKMKPHYKYLKVMKRTTSLEEIV